jgi:hypothetical protein
MALSARAEARWAMKARMFVSALVFFLMCSLASPEGLIIFPGPNFPIVSDLNHDGVPDLVGAGFNADGSPNITAVLDKGKGAFTAPIISNITGLTLPSPLQFVVGDFNSDGFPDIALIGSDPVTGVAAVGVMLGNGNGSFQSIIPTDIPGNRGLTGLLAGDFTGDGNLDLVTFEFGTNVLAVLPGHGNGTFGTPITTSTDIPFSCPAAADFNHDGKLDMILDSYVYLGNGDGTFEPPIPIANGGCVMAVSDLNRDGNLDVITLNSNQKAIWVHFGDGTGNFSSGTEYKLSNYSGPLAVADFNGDSYPDIAVLNGGVQDVTILLNNQDGTFKVGDTFDGGAYALVAGDFNNDSKQDLVISGGVHGGGGLSVIIGNGDGTFDDTLAQNNQVSTFLLPGDFNNDHKLDLLTNSYVEIGSGDGTLHVRMPLPTGCGGTNVAVGDFNNDHILDLATTTDNGSLGVSICLGKGGARFNSPVVYDQDIQHTLVATGDFNHDGNLDLAVSDVGGISILLGNGDGTFQNGIPTAFTGFSNLVLGDFNGDGNLDIAANTGSTISVLLGKGNGTFQAPITSQSGGTIQAVGDLNKDGRLDLVTTEVPSNANSIGVMLGNGDGTFRIPIAYTLTERPGQAVLADFNQDGKLDVAVSVLPHFVFVYLGNGDGTLQQPRMLYDDNSPNGPTSLAAGDFNNDGVLDIAVLTKLRKQLVFLKVLNIEPVRPCVTCEIPSSRPINPK